MENLEIWEDVILGSNSNEPSKISQSRGQPTVHTHSKDMTQIRVSHIISPLFLHLQAKPDLVLKRKAKVISHGIIVVISRWTISFVLCVDLHRNRWIRTFYSTYLSAVRSEPDLFIKRVRQTSQRRRSLVFVLARKPNLMI